MPTVTFAFDVICIAELHLITGNKDLKFLKILKVVAFTRLSKIIMHLTFKEDVKALMKLTYTVLTLIMYIHFIACIWNRIIIVNKIWIPPFDYVDYTAVVFFKDETSIGYRYLTCVYDMVACIGGNDLGRVSASESIFIC